MTGDAKEGRKKFDDVGRRPWTVEGPQHVLKLKYIEYETQLALSEENCKSF